MSDTFQSIRKLVADGELRVSEHGWDELSDDGIEVRDVIAGVTSARVVEDYPDYAKGPAVLVLEFDSDRRPVHAVWGIPRGRNGPAVLITAYRPSVGRWGPDFVERRT